MISPGLGAILGALVDLFRLAILYYISQNKLDGVDLGSGVYA